MQTVDCQKHRLKKNHIFCLETDCKDRLVCKKCFMMDKQHYDHQYISIDYFMDGDKDELERVFNQTYAESVNNGQNVKQFSELLDLRFNKFMDEREEIIRQPFEKMISDYRLTLKKLKTQLCQKYKVDQVKSVQQIQQNMQQLIDNDNSEQKQQEMKEIIDSSKQIIEIQKKLDSLLKQVERGDKQMVSRIQDAIDGQKAKIDAQLGQTTNYLETAKQFKQYTKISIIDVSKIDEYKSQIQQYQQKGKQFKIIIGFYYITDPNQRKQIFEMIQQCDANDTVAEMNIKINNDNRNDVELVVTMLNKYTNIYYIYIYDYLDQVDNNIHNQLKILVKTRTLLQFFLGFYEGLKNSDGSLDLIKYYNQLIIKDEDHLERLQYRHSRINKIAQHKKQIEQLINRISNI